MILTTIFGLKKAETTDNADLTVFINDNMDILDTEINNKLDSSLYTASDVLTKIKTVDGSGSGLDADMLDSLNSTDFLRSNTSSSFTGSYLDFGSAEIRLQENHFINKRFEMIENSSPQYIILCENGANNDVNGHIRMDRTSGNYQSVSLDVLVSSGTGAMYGGMLSTNQVLQSSETYNLVSFTYSGTSYIGIRYTGNTYPETTGVYFTGRLVSTGLSLTTVDAVTDVVSFGGNSKSNFDVDNLTVRENVVWHAGNDGSSSGLNADLLDGLEASQFLRSDVNTVADGNIDIVAPSSGIANLGLFEGDSDYGSILRYDGVTNEFQLIGIDVGVETVGLVQDRAVSTSGLTYKGNTIWHAGNDGSGSGLNADLLDGEHASAFANASHTHAYVPTSRTVNGKALSSNITLTAADVGAQPSGTYNTIIGTDTDIDTAGATVLDTLVMTDGVITSHSTRTLTLADLGYTGATNANNYSHPTYNGDDFSVDTGVLSGATVVSDIDINVTTDTEGHVTDANGVVSTRTITLANLGFTGDTDATNDQTKAEIDALNVDADTVDNLHASQFLRSDASDTTTGQITANLGFKTGNFEIVHNATTDSLDFNYIG